MSRAKKIAIKNTLSDFLSFGHFPKELPPPFTTENFKSFFISATIKEPKSASRGISYSIPKLGLIRKNLTITNPCHQAPLFKYIAENWEDIKREYDKSSISFSKPLYTGNRSVNPKSFTDFFEHCFKSSFANRYKLQTDITKYYPSIYTHSIPWAIYGKEYSKLHRFDNNLGNNIDKLIRKTQSDQTVGIPIGPDSSLIISELIGVDIDKKLSKHLLSGAIGFRYVDDMIYFFNEYSQAEVFLKELQHIAKEYELTVNTEKTFITKLPDSIEKDWTISLRNFPISDEYYKKQESDLLKFFSVAFDFSQKNPKEFILLYAIRRIKKQSIFKEAFDTYESLLLKTLISEPSTMPDILAILLRYKKWVKKEKIKTVIQEIINFSTIRGYDFEVAWALWYAKTFSIKLDKTTTTILSSLTNPIPMLIALDLAKSKLIDMRTLRSPLWIKSITEDSLLDEKWLFAYEIAIKKWTSSKYEYIKNKTSKNEYFNTLLKNKVSFYDNTKQVDFDVEIDFIEPDNDATSKTIKTKKVFSLPISDYL